MEEAEYSRLEYLPMLHSTENYDMILTERGSGIWNLHVQRSCWNILV